MLLDEFIAIVFYILALGLIGLPVIWAKKVTNLPLCDWLNWHWIKALFAGEVFILHLIYNCLKMNIAKKNTKFMACSDWKPKNEKKTPFFYL